MPTTEIHFRERLFVVNLASLMVVGIPVTLEVAMGLAYGRKLGKSDLVFFRTRSFPQGTEGGSTSGKMFDAERRRCVLVIHPFLIWL